MATARKLKRGQGRLVRQTARFTNMTKQIHRLTVDELADSSAADVTCTLGEMNKGAVTAFADLMKRGGGATLRQVDPLFLHVALVGLFDFFVSAEPVVRALVPEETDMEALSAAYQDFVARTPR